jgi:hypothetical protein
MQLVLAVDPLDVLDLACGRVTGPGVLGRECDGVARAVRARC